MALFRASLACDGGTEFPVGLLLQQGAVRIAHYLIMVKRSIAVKKYKKIDRSSNRRCVCF